MTRKASLPPEPPRNLLVEPLDSRRKVRWFHRVGHWLEDLRRSEAWRSAWVDRLAAKFGRQRADLYRAMQLARRYDKTRLKDLDGLSWAHVKTLVKVADDGVREELRRRALAEGWSVQALEREVRRRQGVSWRPDLGPLIGLSRAWREFVAGQWPPARREALGPGDEPRLTELLTRADAALRELIEAFEQRP
jgi:hypothetical protein